MTKDVRRRIRNQRSGPTIEMDVHDVQAAAMDANTDAPTESISLEVPVKVAAIMRRTTRTNAT